MEWFWWLIVGFVVFLWIASFVDIIRRRHSMSGVRIAAWVLILLVFPVLGTIVYFLVRGAPSTGAVRDLDRVRGTELGP